MLLTGAARVTPVVIVSVKFELIIAAYTNIHTRTQRLTNGLEYAAALSDDMVMRSNYYAVFSTSDNT